MTFIFLICFFLIGTSVYMSEAHIYCTELIKFVLTAQILPCHNHHCFSFYDYVVLF
ncbi:hypothetical protein GLOIN_2v1558527 [Rhizophagus irregularis DAOM 181602=DAOM 197198]|uniref:Uncharacterized protein n=1 Tax=Rhizophagus irregularis (strain DAOM 181602 / DAOM 197198 / MUCL 43194) TaxID=747089 RepID=A0A2P4QER8_RHIID|nr:hypothetical protein GLOIN_2v1558527 [Rhizophagus irregularis DAOM 181602=DAOM 197198]POG76116.1 hypothetical protein GLOIN_2v1558527 [Rhizophagus irregularis DAOM 181602=DAOM 197198]|eukprot:XP_025182982.1 hypothetical protein GLOIN_2v1558527 [Rhizophagus irregularis DAOM 181602=DAOM 197198]